MATLLGGNRVVPETDGANPSVPSAPAATVAGLPAAPPSGPCGPSVADSRPPMKPPSHSGGSRRTVVPEPLPVRFPDERTISEPLFKWKVLGKLAMIAQSITPREASVIDIYHEALHGTTHFMVHPNSKTRRFWEISTAICVLYVVTMVPLMLGFSYVDWSGLAGINTFLDWYFVADMVMTLRTGIVSNGEVIMDFQVVARKYLHSWFIVDLVSNFPLALFVPSSGKSLKIVKLQKIPKLLRVRRLLRYLREYAKYYNLALSFLALVLGLHLFACLWASLFNECFDGHSEVLCDNSDMGPMYIQSIHTVMLMFLGIGESSTFASIARLQDPETFATIEIYMMSLAVFLVGMVFTSFLFGNVLALLMSWDQQKAQFRNRMDIISAEMKYYELPEDLQHRVRRNYDYLWINQRAYSDMMLLNQPGISKPLRTTIALHLYKDLVRTVPFFAGSDARFLGKVCLALETAVYLPGDTIIYYDEIGKEMFIVRKGLVEILVPDGDQEKRVYLRDGNFFGETALVIDVRRTNTVKAVNICDLNVLSKRAFNEIAAEYPEFGERMKRTVIKRQLDNMNIQSPAEKIKVQNQLNMVVEKSLKQRRMSVSLRTIYRAKKLGDKLKEIADRASRVNVQSVRRLSRVALGRTLKLSRSQRAMFEANSGVLGVDPGFSRVLKPSVSLPTAGAGSLVGGGFVPSAGAFGNGNLGGGATAAPINGRRIDKVSRKLSKAELTLDLIPSALAEISAMVTQIRHTTDRLSRRIETRAESEMEESDPDYDDDYTDGMTSPFESEPPQILDSMPISRLSEETEEEAARRESNSIFVPNENTRSSRKSSEAIAAAASNGARRSS